MEEMAAEPELLAWGTCGDHVRAWDDCYDDCDESCCPASSVFVKAGYLMFWTRGLKTPPLVTSSPQPPQTGILGEPGTGVIFGDESLFTGLRSGGRLVAGVWCDSCQTFGIEGEYLALGDASLHFHAGSRGDPVLARPFFNALTAQQDSELVAYPGVVEGIACVESSSRFSSAGVRLRINRWCQPLCGEHACDCNVVRGHRRWDLLVGYRFLRLDENLAIFEDLRSTDPEFPADFDIRDAFDTENEFHGAEFGVLYEGQFKRWSLEMWAKVALGNSHQVVRIAGNTDITDRPTGVTESFQEGILALRTNIGRYTQDDAAVVPELGARLGYELACGMEVTVGYTFISWSPLVRPGDQIDPVLNPNLFPELADPFFGPMRPTFCLNETRFWAQGLTLGLGYRW
jgi:hypothetical protein